VVEITVVTQDTRGGVQPYAALARALVDAGHGVRAVAPAELAWLFERVGVDCLPLDGMSSDQSREVALAAQSGRHGGLRTAARALVAKVPGWAGQIHRFAVGSNILTGGVGGAVIGRPVADALQVPWVSAHLQPVGMVNTTYPGVLMTGIPRAAGGAGNLLGQLLTEAAIRMPFQQAQRAARRALATPRGAAPKSPGTIYGISPAVIQPPANRGQNRVVTGYWFDNTDPDVLPPELQEFIAQGGDKPTVSIGFGSMVADDPDVLRDLLTGAAHDVGARVVLIAGAGAVGHPRAGEWSDLIAVPSVPHLALFQRMDANVHHAGAGTTANALAAGVPSVMIPFGADQPFWARRANDLGVAPPAIPIPRLTRARLTQALNQALTDLDMRDRADDLGRRIRSEDGTGVAAQWYSSLSA
jgi:UDP:flavonoid glycosyltransferase YjiC (YdhE family)